LIIKEDVSGGKEICFDREGLAFLINVIRNIEHFGNND